MTAPRSAIASSVLVVVATIVLPLALVSAWLAAVVTDTDRYVDTVAPPAENPTVQTAVEVRLESALLAVIDVKTREQQIADLLADRDLSPRVRLGLRALSGSLEGAITGAVHNAVVRVVRDPEFATAWATANRSAHEQLVAILSGEQSELVTSEGRVSIQLSTLLNTVLGILGEQGILDPANLPEVQAGFTFIDADDLSRAQTAYTILDRLGYWLPLIWLVLVGLAVLLARDRRRAVRFLSYGAVLGVVLLAIALRIGREQVVGLVPDDTDVVREVWDILVVSLRASMRTMLVLALLVLVVAWISGPGRVAVRVRELVGSTSESASAKVGYGALRACLLGLGVLVVFVWVV
ncbi:membrane hypothetical protein [metagenome]|uniref:Integral membrane protein n=1 Tax=metagenome TaxID=256318 RepID=A0A2P2BZ49_9ZZZZ